MRWGSRVARRKGRKPVALGFCHPACATKQEKTHDWGWDRGQWYVNTKDDRVFQLPLDNYVATEIPHATERLSPPLAQQQALPPKQILGLACLPFAN